MKWAVLVACQPRLWTGNEANEPSSRFEDREEAAMASAEEDVELQELVDFLDHKREDVRQMAAQHVEALSGSVDGAARLGRAATKLYPSLLRGMAEDVHRATAIVNMSQDELQAKRIAECGAVERCMDMLRDGDCEHKHLATMLLVNLTQVESCAEGVLRLDSEKLKGVHAVFLLRRIASSPPEELHDPFEHAADVLTNLTRLEAGRAVLTDQHLAAASVLVEQLESGSATRRRGAAACLKNLCMEEESVKSVMDQLGEPHHIETEIQEGGGTLKKTLWEKLLQPLSGRVPKEHDAQVRALVAETVLCIASYDAGRKALWKANAPELLRKGYEYEEDPAVCSAMEQTAEFFISTAQDAQEESVLPSAQGVNNESE